MKVTIRLRAAHRLLARSAFASAFPALLGASVLVRATEPSPAPARRHVLFDFETESEAEAWRFVPRGDAKAERSDRGRIERVPGRDKGGMALRFAARDAGYHCFHVKEKAPDALSLVYRGDGSADDFYVELYTRDGGKSREYRMSLSLSSRRWARVILAARWFERRGGAPALDLSKFERVQFRLPGKGEYALTVDRIALSAGERSTRAVGAGNLLPNSSFEETTVAREIYPIVGEYRDRGAGQWTIDTRHAVHGKQSLRMAGTAPFFWQVLNARSYNNVFSAYLRGSRPGQRVELGIEYLSYIDDGAVYVESGTNRVVTLGADWQRYELPLAFKWNKRPYDRLHMHRTWVRPLSGAPCWLDAAQLEVQTTEAGPYSAVRGGNALGSNMRFGRLVGKTADLPEYAGKRSQSGRVKITVREPSGTARVNEPVWGGVPFPNGELFDESLVRLTDAAGREVPCQTHVLARRHIDGSITSLLLDFQTTVRANGRQTYTLHYGPGATPGPAGVLATEDDSAIQIDTGAIKAVLGKNAFRWFDTLEAPGGKTLDTRGLRVGALAQTVNGALYGSDAGKPDELFIERNGPLHAVICARGKHHAREAKRTFLNYEARIHAFADKPYFLLEHSFENREQAMNTPVRGILVRLPVAGGPGGAVTGRFRMRKGDDVRFALARGEQIRLTQLHDYYGAGRYDVAVDRAGAGAAQNSELLEQRRASGLLQAGHTRIAVHDFLELNPKALEVDRRSATVWIWPDRHVRFVDLPFGLANTVRLAYAPFGGEQDGAALAEFPLLVQPDNRWVRDTRVFDHFLTGAETARDYPRFHKHLDRYFEVLARDRELTDLTGMFDYGDIGAPKKWMNNETTALQNLWTQYLRTGEPALFRRACSLARHLREIDICHIEPGTKLMHHPSGGYHTTFGWHVGHYWISGLIYHYLLTGDMRTYQIVRDVGAGPMLKYRISKYVGRERTRMLLHLAELYDLTHLKCFRHAFETQYNFGKPTLSSDYYGGNGLLLLKRWYDTTGESPYLERFKRDADNFLERRTRKIIPGDGVQGRCYLYSAMPLCRAATGNDDFIKVFFERLVWHTVSAHAVDHNAVRGTSFLAAAREIGLREHRMMPENPLGIALLCGRMQTPAGPKGVPRFRVRIDDRHDEPFVVRVYRTRKFRAKHDRTNDTFAVKFTRPDGTVLFEEAMTGTASAFWREIPVPRDGQRNDYFVEMDCLNDGRGAFSCSLPRTYLDARRRFAFRRDQGATGSARFAFRAPVSRDRIHVRLKWHDKSGEQGQTTGISIQDVTGRVLAHRRWVGSMGTVYDEHGKPLGLVDGLELPIPAAHRGKPLVLTVWANKWMGWQIEGLDEPWLAASTEAFE